VKCFYHREADAVGTCKACNKGLCAACAVDVGGGLACRDRCEEQVRNITQLIERNIQLSPASQAMLGKQPGVYLSSGAFQLVAGSVFTFLGFNMHGVFRLGIMGVGILIAGLGVWQIVYGLGVRKATGRLK